MPTYLLHGFRWPRPLIRIHIILQNLDDAAAEWLCSPSTSRALLANFNELFPDAMSHLPGLRFIEQYDPNDLSAASLSQPFAYVADIVQEVSLGLDVDEVRGKGVGTEQWGSLMDIRDRLAPDEKVGWWVVVCGDEERWAPPTNDLIRGGYPMSNGTSTKDHHQTNRVMRNGTTKPIAQVGTSDSSLGNNSEHQADAQIRNLREQLGYRTDSDVSESSSSQTPSGYTSTTATTLGAGVRTPDTTVLDRPSSATSSPKEMGRVRRWLSKRKSQKSMKELAKAQSREQVPPLPPNTSPTMGHSSQLPVR